MELDGRVLQLHSGITLSGIRGSVFSLMLLPLAAARRRAMGSSAKSSGVETGTGTDGGHSVDGGRQGCGWAGTHQAEQTIWAMGHLSVSVPHGRQAGRALHKPALCPEKALPGSFGGENEKIQCLMVCVMRPEIDDS